jgi:chitinase
VVLVLLLAVICNSSASQQHARVASPCVSSIVTESIFESFLSRRESAPASGFYTYDAFLAAAKAYDGFGTSGSVETQKRELAAFFANVAHETGSK